MRELHVLGVSEDGSELLLAPAANATKPTHTLVLDEKLKAAAQGRLAPFGSERVQPSLSPKEMQARLREGATVEEVAKAAGVPVARVLPYFAPVEAERDRIVEQARLAPMSRNRGPASTKPLGLVVDARLMDVGGIKPESIEWSARRRRDGAWVVSVAYYARGRRTAEWLWSPTARELAPVDPAAARLGADLVASPKRAKPKPRPKPAPAPAGKKKAAAKKPAVKKAVKAAKPLKPVKAVPVKPVPVKAVKPPRPQVVPAPAPEPEEVATPAYEPEVIPLPVTAVKPVAVVPDPEPEPEVEPEAQAEPVAEDEPAAEPAPPRKPGQRVPLPSWDDVLLGTVKRG